MDPQNQNNMTPGTAEVNSSGSSAGPIIGIIVILAIVILGGLYFWSQRSATEDSSATDKTVETINIQSSSDNPSSIEADLNTTDIENLDAEINAS